MEWEMVMIIAGGSMEAIAIVGMGVLDRVASSL